MKLRERTKIPCVSFPRERDGPPSAYAAALCGSLTFQCVTHLTECLPTSTDGRGIGFCSCLSCLHLLRSSGRSRLFVLVSSLHPDGALNHPHYSRITPAVEVRK